VYLVCAQPPGSPSVDFFLNAGTPYRTGWVWPTVSTASLQPGKTYVLGGNINGLNGYTEFNVSFTYSSSCTATSYNSAGPTGNQGWRFTGTQVDTTHELAAVPAPSIATWTGPTTFGTSRSLKMSLYLDYVDVCNCIFVNWIGFITQDANTTGTYHAHYWNSANDKREAQNRTLEKRCKRDSLEKRHNNALEKRTACGYPCEGPGWVGNYRDLETDPTCDCWPCPTPFSKGSNDLGSWAPGGDPDSKRTTYYLYWLAIFQRACTGVPTVGSYGHGASGSVQTGSALGTTYI